MSLIVFSDLDGTLLDHETYGFDAARPALDRLVRLGIPVILASSKTRAEMRPLQQAMGLPDWPMIRENGADGEPDAYARLRAALNALDPALRTPFEGFGDMGTARVAALTGLDPDAAARARQREATEPGLWQGGDGALGAFLAALARAGIVARRGGRFLTLSFGGTKADRMAEIMAALNRSRSIALGDAPNDAEMLDFADIGVIIENPNAPPMPALGAHVIRSALPGPRGWAHEIGRLLDEAGCPE
jgi:mannosyl-3-phosphoglycerate phosphatase